MWVGLMNGVGAMSPGRGLRVQRGAAPRAARGGSATGPAGGRPPRAGAGSGSDLITEPGPRRPSPMVASKPVAEGLVGAEAAPGSRAAPVGTAVSAPNPYSGVGRNDP